MLKKIAHEARYVRSKLRERTKSHGRSPDWDKTRDAHIKLHGTCAACGSQNRLQVHHIEPVSNRPDLELSPDNLITLCMDIEECHFRIGHGGSFTHYNPSVAEDAKNFRSAPAETRKIIVENARKKRLD